MTAAAHLRLADFGSQLNRLAARPFPALLVVGLAFFLRVYRLGDNNVWWDEGWTIWLSRHDLAWIALRTASDEHPPLHYWLMHFWGALAGWDAFAGRFFSVLFGVLMVALLYRIGRKLGGPQLGLLAALLLALGRFHVWWSQDIKNYTLSAFFALAGIWFMLELLFPAGRTRGARVGYVLATTLALYSHYLAALIFLANNLFVLLVLLRAWRRGERPVRLFVGWSLAQLAVLALFAPWLALYLQNAASWSAAPAFDFGLFLRLAATVLPLGVTTYIENYAALVAALTLLAALGAAWLFVRPGWREADTLARDGALLALLIVLIPPALIYLLSLTPAAFFAPKVQARYLLILLPAYLLLLALGVLLLSRRSRPLALLALVLVTAAQLWMLDDYYRGRVLRDEYSTLANVINSFAAPGDAIILNTDQEWPTFLYYLDAPRPWLGVPNGVKVDAAGAHRVAAQAGQYSAVWVVSIPDALEKDPRRLVEAELGQHWSKQYERTFGDKRLALYAANARNVRDVAPAQLSPQVGRNLDLDSRLHLLGFDLPVREVQPGDTVRVVTYWQSSDPATIETELRRPDDPNALVARSTSISVGAGERAEADLVVPADAGPGPLRVIVKARLAQVELAGLTVLPGRYAASAARMTDEVNLDLGGAPAIQLAGYDLPRREFHAGESVPLTLFWRAAQTPTLDYTVFVHLLGSQYNPAQDNFLWGQVDRVPRAGRLPTTAWPPGITLDDPYAIPIAANAPAGRYKIEVGLYEAATGARLRVSDAAGRDLGDSIIMAEIQIQ